ncbi:MAG: carbohydrate kinase family protein [Erysipelotrichaceae bacterium]|nr:carbohydrate kinase family protein [Erysipelotrichaceae bacterium]
MTQKKQDYICVIGAVNVDIIAASYVRLIHQDSNPGTVKISYGGVGRNIAENLSRLGQRVELITALGDDLHAEEINDQCEELNISLKHSLHVKDESTSMYICINDDRGEMQLAVSAMEIYDKMTPEFFETKLDVINGASAVVMDLNLSASAVKYLCKYVKAPIFVDPVSTRKALKIKSCLKQVYAIKPNRMEAELILGRKIKTDEDVLSAAKRFLDLGVQRVFISLAENGVCYADEDSTGFVRAGKPRVVNTTGCGDAFMAGMVTGFVQHKETKECAEMGQRASGICLRTERAVSINMNLKEVEGDIL